MLILNSTRCANFFSFRFFISPMNSVSQVMRNSNAAERFFHFYSLETCSEKFSVILLIELMVHQVSHSTFLSLKKNFLTHFKTNFTHHTTNISYRVRCRFEMIRQKYLVLLCIRFTGYMKNVHKLVIKSHSHLIQS